MKPSIKAIKTVYNGYCFRSRTEARWAVFFDTLGIPYEYEKEGYEQTNGLRYLPDFWLPEQDCWVEIKGQMPTEEENEKAIMLALVTQKPVFTLWGVLQPFSMESVARLSPKDVLTIFEETGEYYSPDDIRLRGTLGHAFRPNGAEIEFVDTFYRFAECPRCHRLEITSHGLIRDISCGCYPESEKANSASRRLTEAYAFARRADFGRNGLK